MRQRREISHSELKSLLSYDKKTGVWRWKEKRSWKILKGQRAGGVRRSGYRVIKLHGVAYYSSVLAYFYVNGFWCPQEIDHKNLVKDDDRWVNLRSATRQQNCVNKNVQSTSRLGVKGVRKFRGRYRSQIGDGKKLIHLGMFDTAEQASLVYQNKTQRTPRRVFKMTNCTSLHIFRSDREALASE